MCSNISYISINNVTCIVTSAISINTVTCVVTSAIIVLILWTCHNINTNITDVTTHATLLILI
jgi:hypothetical protein